MDETVEITLYHRENCGMCEDMLDALKHYSAELNFELIVYDIDEDEALFERFNERVPMVYAGSDELMYYEFDLKALTTAVLI